MSLQYRRRWTSSTHPLQEESDSSSVAVAHRIVLFYVDMGHTLGPVEVMLSDTDHAVRGPDGTHHERL